MENNLILYWLMKYAKIFDNGSSTSLRIRNVCFVNFIQNNM